nr:glycoside hydrolase family 32 protein [Streptomyces sp. NBC_00899]
MSPTARDPHLPAVHPRPPKNWINDPNGLCFHDGHYHVFHQYNPHGPEHSGVHWGHMRSTDLVSWQSLPVALTPTPGGEDADGCFSGNAVSHKGRLIAFYSAYRKDRWHQPIAAAESRDGGLTWAKRPGLLIPDPPPGTTMYRDPYVWRHDGGWRMLVGAGLTGDRGAALLYESPDLESWRYLGPFFAADDGHLPGTGGWTGWECPQYATFGDRGALIVSLWDAADGPSSVRAYVGSEHEGTFQPAAHHLLDHGPDFYAPALLHAPAGPSDPEVEGGGRWLLWGWSWEARDSEWTAQAGWAGVLTLPREISLSNDGRVHQQPARELLLQRRSQLVRATGRSATTDATGLGSVGRTFDLTARLRPEAGDTARLRLTTADDGTEYLDITVDITARHLAVDRNRGSRDPRARRGRYTMPLDGAAGTDGAVEMRVVVDASIVEVFLPTGQAMTVRWYPTAEPPWRLQFLGNGHYTVDAWELGPPVSQGNPDSSGARTGSTIAADLRPLEESSTTS